MEKKQVVIRPSFFPLYLTKKCVGDVLRFLQNINKHQSRRDQVALVESARFFQKYTHAKDYFNACIQMEEQHVRFMVRVLPLVGIVKPVQEPHDYTKDRLYVLITGIYNTAKDHPKILSSVKDIYAKETKLHYILEAHYPDHEVLTENECSDDDIKEMAIDRMARYLQTHDSFTLSRDFPTKCMPIFTKGNVQHKQKLFKQCVEDEQKTVEDLFKNMFCS